MTTNASANADTPAPDPAAQLADLQAALAERTAALGAAEAQRDEARARLVEAENRRAAERLLGASGVVDLEAAELLLGRRIDLTAEELDTAALRRSIEQLLLDKPFLRAARPLPGRTGGVRRAGHSGELADAAERAARSGDRRDVAEYLRLRRSAAGDR
jgi:hypothetical protein